MDAGPCFLCAAAAVVAIYAHIFRVVLATFVWAGHNLPALLISVQAVAAQLVVILLEFLFLMKFIAP